MVLGSLEVPPVLAWLSVMSFRFVSNSDRV